MSFTDEMKKIGENISSCYDARVGTLEDIFKSTQSTLKDARSMVKNFHGNRMHMSEELHSDLEHFKKELTNETRKLMNDTKKMMNELSKQHQEMSAQLREDLDRFHHAMYRETHTMLNEFRSDFNKMADDFKKARQAWQSFSRSIRTKRGKEPAPRKTINKAEQLCSVLQGCPNGMTMGQIAKEMGCSSQSLHMPINNLKKLGRISKRQNKFYCKG